MLRALAAVFVVFLACVPAMAQGIITTIAGTTWTFRGDGGPALNAPIGDVRAIAIDAAGNLYIADIGNNLAHKVSPSQVLAVIAGNGFYDFYGDGGPATGAAFYNISGIAVDATGNVYIADRENGRIRKVTPGGLVTTVAGGGSTFPGDGGPATNAKLEYPIGVAVDSAGNLYIAERDGHRVRKVSAGIITTVAGSGPAGDGTGSFAGDGGPATSARLHGPSAVALDAQGNLYIADMYNRRIRRVTPTGVITTFAGGGESEAENVPANTASLSYPRGVAVDSAGNVIIADTDNHKIRRVNTSGVITTIAGTGSDGFSGDGGAALSAKLRGPESVVMDGSGNLYIADTLNRRVRRIDAAGIIRTVAGSGAFRFAGDNGLAISASLHEATSLARDVAGNLYIADRENHRIRKIDTRGIITTFAGNGEKGDGPDGIAATSASLNEPHRLSIGTDGSVYFTDSGNHRVRRVTTAGILQTVAGNGFWGKTPDGQPAAGNSLAGPWGLLVDPQGNIYIGEVGNHKIRKVTPGGALTTVAGNGEEGSSGDGGLATAAMIHTPLGLALDSSGNLYFSDLGAHRIRRVTPGGLIGAVAGTGVPGFSGDNGAPTAAQLRFPAGLRFDNQGALLVADWGNYRVRRLVPSGIITTIAGNGEWGASGDGGPSTNASMNYPFDALQDAAGNLYIAHADRVRLVLAARPSFAVSATTLSFAGAAGDVPPPGQNVFISSGVSGLRWSATVSTTSGGNWLAVSPGQGTTPAALAVTVNPAGLSVGAYQGRITIQAPEATPPTATVDVTLEVLTQTQLPALVVEPGSVRMEARAGSRDSRSETIVIRNAGGGTMQWTARAALQGGPAWLSVSAGSGSATPSSPSALEVRASAADLAAGVYAGVVVVENPAQAQQVRVPVTFLVTPVTGTILVGHTGLLFTAVEGIATVQSQSTAIVNTGTGTMNWTAQASTLGGGNWLSVSPATGSSQGASTEVPVINITVNPQGLVARRYSGVIRIDAPGATNTPQFVSVDLNVLPPGSDPGVSVHPRGLIFATQAGTASPGSQGIRLVTAGRAVDARVGVLTLDGGDWLEVQPNALAIAAEPRTLTVQPRLGSRSAGVNRGVLTLLMSDNSVQTVNVLFVVAPAATGASDAEPFSAGAASTACTPQRLYAAARTLGNNFSVSTGWPTALEVQVVDDCGNAVTKASVTASFSTGDSPVVLNSLGNGIYAGVWQPAKAGTGTITATIRATMIALEAAELKLTGQVASGLTAVPALFSGGVVNGASYAPGAPLAPGGIISLFGTNLAKGLFYANTLPLGTVLGGISVKAGDLDVPLFFSGEGQLNAQLPTELPPNTSPQLLVRAKRETGAEYLTLPETITVAEVQPAIFTTNQGGTGQGAILDVQGRLVDGSAPAGVGEVVQVFCTGLGATSPAVATGQPAPAAEPLARVTAQVAATIGGKPATVHFAGLAPTFVGLYQVNVEIPAGVTPGSAVALVLTQKGVSSNPVTLAIK